MDTEHKAYFIGILIGMAFGYLITSAIYILVR